MILDLKRTVLKIHLRRFITLMIFVVLILLILLVLDMHNTYFGLSVYQLAIVIAGLYLVIIIFQGLLELNYIYFNDQGDKIILRYFSMSYYNSRKQTIEIPREKFSRYEIKSSLGGLKKKLILYERVKNKDAKYPAVSITALNKNQFKNLSEALERSKTVFN